jgi:hypothetical protein
MKFFTYRQNNSGGVFSGPAQYVIIQADSSDQADDIAQDNGLYFNGIASGMDCQCCGDRWNRQYDFDDATDVPMIYDTPASDYVPLFPNGDGIPVCKVFFKNADTVTY